MRIIMWEHLVWEHLPAVFTFFGRKLICDSLIQQCERTPPKHCLTLRLKYLCVEHKATIKIIDQSRTVARDMLLTHSPYGPGMPVCPT